MSKMHQPLHMTLGESVMAPDLINEIMEFKSKIAENEKYGCKQSKESYSAPLNKR